MSSQRGVREAGPATSAAGGRSDERHWQHRGEAAPDPGAHAAWCEAQQVQMIADAGARLDGDGAGSGAVHAAAARGVDTPASALPHGDRIQAAFGDHDVSGVKAHVGGGAADACASMGATAFASGDHVAFASTPDLHTAAHEAAHVVQQARGVNLYGGVGDEGDVYERHADAVADAVVAGRSAAPLLSAGPAGGAAGATPAVQRKTSYKDTGSRRDGGTVDGKALQVTQRIDRESHDFVFTDKLHLHEFALHVAQTYKEDVDSIDLVGAYQGFLRTSPLKGPSEETTKETSKDTGGSGGSGPTLDVTPTVETKPVESKPVENKPVEDQTVKGPETVGKTTETTQDSTTVVTPTVTTESKPKVTPAQTWQKWADDNVGTGHTVVDGAGGLLVVNDMIDCVPNLLEELSSDTKTLVAPPKPSKGKAPPDPFEGNTWTTTLHGMLEATKSHAAGNKVAYLEAVLTKLSSSKGGRLRFRHQIGHQDDESDSIVDAFIDAVIAPAYSGNLPSFMEAKNLTPMARKRLYDMPNARGNDANKPAIEWAVAQGASTPGQLVNFGEYYLASKDNIAERAKGEGWKQFQEQKDDIDPQKKDFAAEALRLAKERLKKGVEDIYNPLLGVISKAAKLSDITDDNGTLLQQLLGSDYGSLSSLDLNIPKSPNRGNVIKKVKEKIAAKVTTEQLTATATTDEEEQAKESTRKRMEEALLKQLTDEAREDLTKSFAKDVVSSLAGERKIAREAGYAGTGVAIDGFWEKAPDEQIKALQSKAAEGPIPFTSDDSAAYHSLKHYMDIRSTEDAKLGSGPLQSYLMSSRKTVQSPEATDTQLSQFSSHPAFFFFRTVPYKPRTTTETTPETTGEDEGTKDVKGVKMRAIVIVTDDGKPMVATYFRA